MAFEEKPNTWALFKSTRKDPNNPAHQNYSDYDGSLLTQIEHTCPKCNYTAIIQNRWFLNGWLKEGKQGAARFFSGIIKMKNNQGGSQQPQNAQGQFRDEGMDRARSQPTQQDMNYRNPQAQAPAQPYNQGQQSQARRLVDEDIPF